MSIFGALTIFIAIFWLGLVYIEEKKPKDMAHKTLLKIIGTSDQE